MGFWPRLLSRDGGSGCLDGPRQRLVPVPDSALAAIREYLTRGRTLLVGEREHARVLVNQRGEALTRQGLYKIIQRPYRDAWSADDVSTRVTAAASLTPRIAPTGWLD